MSDQHAALNEVHRDIAKLRSTLEGMKLSPFFDQENVIAAEVLLAIVKQVVEAGCRDQH